MESLTGNLPSPAMAVNELYKERNDFIIIGLTGRTGSGCSTVSQILEKVDFKDLRLPPPYEADFTHTDQRKYRVIYNYLKPNWSNFTTISMSVVISTYLLQSSYIELKEHLEEMALSFQQYSSLYSELEKLYSTDLVVRTIKLLNKRVADGKRVFYDKNTYEETILIYRNASSFWKSLKSILEKHPVQIQCHNAGQPSNTKSNLYSSLFQSVGNNIRAFGTAFGRNCDSQVHMLDLAYRTNDVIQAFHKKNDNDEKCTHICIDAIRNPYEAVFFHDRYTAFYLVSVNTDESERLRRLSNLSKPEIDCLDETECPSGLKRLDSFTKQNIAACIQLSDIYIKNPKCETVSTDNPELTKQIVKYVCLMMHPGLVTPTAVERCMQVAYNAKLNSGCLSRQVGAVITDSDFSIKAIGWNDVASGQIPCNLRDMRALCQYHDRSSHSNFELENEKFRRFMEKKYEAITYSDLKGRLYPFCFSEMYNAHTAEELNKNSKRSEVPSEQKEATQYVKNQVYTRALHAEENAFLQISKYGGQGIQGGFLFVTASPCELCSKKSYQLGIRRIYYIDPYPGIAREQIIEFGPNKESNPELHIFSGAIGRAYTVLFAPRMAYKDELIAILDNKTE